MTNAQLIYELSRLSRISTMALANLSEGVWNPNFCSSNCDEYAASVCADFRARINHIESRIQQQAEQADAEATR